MKYQVMECHPGYAVLMDEDARFVRAANLHYAVGQTVTNPVLMQADTEKRGITHTQIIRIAAIAACLILMSAVGLGIYFKTARSKPQSVVMLVEEKRYEMALNSSGDVIYIRSESENGESYTDSYDEQPLALASAVESVLQSSIDTGVIAAEEPVQIFLAAENEKSGQKIKEEIEQEAAKLSLNADVQELPKTDPRIAPPEPGKEPAHEPPKHENSGENKLPPAPGKDAPRPGENPPGPGKEPAHTEDQPPAPGEKTEPAEKPPVPGKDTDSHGEKPPVPGKDTESRTDTPPVSGTEPVNPENPPAPKTPDEEPDKPVPPDTPPAPPEQRPEPVLPEPPVPEQELTQPGQPEPPVSGHELALPEPLTPGTEETLPQPELHMPETDGHDDTLPALHTADVPQNTAPELQIPADEPDAP